MKLTVLGAGTYQPELRRHSSSYLVQVGRQSLIFDFGRGALDQLMKASVEYFNIDAIFISHTHPDHISELTSFLHIALAEPEKGQLRNKKVTIYGPRGLRNSVNHLLKATHLFGKKPRFAVIIKELKDESVVRGKNWVVRSFDTEHSESMKSFAYRMSSQGRVLAYSGDCEDCTGLRRSCRGADVAIIEASWPDELEPAGHLTGRQVGKIASEEKVKKVVATHVAPYYLKKYNVKGEVRENYDGEVVLARDLLSLNI